MPRNMSINKIRKLDSEILVDKIVARHKAYVFIDRNWIYEKKYNALCREIEIPGVTLYVRFYAEKGQKGINPKTGDIDLELTPSNALYYNNVFGVLAQDRKKLYEQVRDILTDNLIMLTDIRDITYRNFGIRHIEHSLCYAAESEEEGEEKFRLFKKLAFSKHEPGKLGKGNGDFPTSFYFSTPSEVIVLYNKTVESEKHGKKIRDNIWRLEIRCIKPREEYKDFGSIYERFEKNKNKSFANLLKARRLNLDFLPRKEYWDLIKPYLEARKKEYLADKERKKNDYPRYLIPSTEKIIKFLSRINRIGAYKARKKNRDLYANCLELCDELKISVLYTQLDRKINFLDNILLHKDWDYVFCCDDELPCTGEDDNFSVVTPKRKKVIYSWQSVPEYAAGSPAFYVFVNSENQICYQTLLYNNNDCYLCYDKTFHIEKDNTDKDKSKKLIKKKCNKETFFICVSFVCFINDVLFFKNNLLNVDKSIIPYKRE